MFKKIISMFCLITVCQISSTVAANSQTMGIECSPELKESVIQIQKLSEGRELIAKVQQEGQIRILVNNVTSDQFAAFWDPDNRHIYVTLYPDREPGSLIGSILFELHNALVSSKLDYYDSLATQGKISREDYVEAIERLEYQNSLNTAKIAESGIRAGLFHRGARLPTYSSFEEHFRIQKMGGHSAWIARNYDMMSPIKNRNSYSHTPAYPRVNQG